MGMDHPSCFLPAQALFGHCPWKQTGVTLTSHSWILEKLYKYLAVEWICSYVESEETKRRRNNCPLKHGTCGRVKREEQPQSRV